MHVFRHRQGDLETLRQLSGTGLVTLLIGRTCPLAGVPEAMPHCQAGLAWGETAITI
jgi:hypothetical protein